MILGDANIYATRALVVFSILTLPTLAHALCKGMELHSHRGAYQAPENSLSGAQLAFKGGWDGVEIDVQQLQDRQWVLHHDFQLGRTTSIANTLTSKMSSTAWSEVRLKKRGGKYLTSESAPFLKDLIEGLPADSTKVMNIEIKQATSDCGAAASIVSELKRGRPDGRWFLTSIDVAQLQCIRRYDPYNYVGLVVLDPLSMAKQTRSRFANRIGPKTIDRQWLEQIKLSIGGLIGIHIDTVTLEANPSLLEVAKSLDIPVFTYSFSSDQQHARLIRTYALRTGFLPSGAIIDDSPEKFCNTVGEF